MLTQLSDFQFFRPILWDNANSDFRYSVGGTANLTKFSERLFILTADHCLSRSKDGYGINDVKIPYRIGSEAYCLVGKGARFSLENMNEPDTDLCDIRIHLLEGSSCSSAPLSKGEFLHIDNFTPSSYASPRYLSGFPTRKQWQDHPSRELGGTGLTVQGYDGGPTNDLGCRFFHSPSLIGLDADGFSGGLITSNLFGNVHLEGVCIRGSNSSGNDFIRFITVEVLKEQFCKAWHALCV